MISAESLVDRIFSNKDDNKFNIENPTTLKVSTLNFEEESMELSREDKISDLEASKETESKMRDAIIYIKEGE